MANVILDEKAIFNVAREIASPDVRAEYLRQACGTDSSLFERVQVLLRVTASASALAKGNNWINRLGPVGAEIVVFSCQSAPTNSTPTGTVSEF